MQELGQEQKQSINGGGIIISSIIAIAGLAFSICTIAISAVNGAKQIEQAKNAQLPTNTNSSFSRSYLVKNL